MSDWRSKVSRSGQFLGQYNKAVEENDSIVNGTNLESGSSRYVAL